MGIEQARREMNLQPPNYSTALPLHQSQDPRCVSGQIPSKDLEVKGLTAEEDSSEWRAVRGWCYRSWSLRAILESTCAIVCHAEQRRNQAPTKTTWVHTHTRYRNTQAHSNRLHFSWGIKNKYLIQVCNVNSIMHLFFDSVSFEVVWIQDRWAAKLGFKPRQLSRPSMTTLNIMPTVRTEREQKQRGSGSEWLKNIITNKL